MENWPWLDEHEQSAYRAGAPAMGGRWMASAGRMIAALHRDLTGVFTPGILLP